MFSEVFLHFLTENNVIDQKQAKEAIQRRPGKARTAVVAVFEKLMTEEQAKTIIELQAKNDMPFGFLAVREGYLTHEQSALIGGRHPRADMLIVQTLSDKGFLSMNDAIDNLELFKKYYNLGEDAYEGLVANKAECYVENIAKIKSGLFKTFAAVFIKSFTKCVDSSLRIDKVYESDSVKGKYIVTVNCCGDKDITIGLIIDDVNSALNIASRFMRQRQTEYNEDTEDSLKEFMNIAAGLFSTALERELSLDVDIQAPLMQENASIKANSIKLIDIYSIDSTAHIFFIEND